MSSTVINPNIHIIHLLAGLAGHHGKRYAFPSQAWLIKHLRLRYQVTMSLRTLNRHLHALERLKMIKRTRRHYNDATLGSVFRSTLYTLGNRALKILSAGHKVGLFLANLRPTKSPNSRLPIMADNLPPKGKVMSGVHKNALPPDKKPKD